MSPALTRQLTYGELLTRLAESDAAPSFTSVRDLPELSLEDLAAALRHDPTVFLEAMADQDPDLAGLCTDRLGDTTQKVTERYAHVGLVIVGAIRAYIRSIVLRDVQALIERNREFDSLEDRLSHREVLGADAELAIELGLGRTLQS